MKKSNAILEYGILLIIVIAAVMGINKLLERHIKAYVKDTTDSKLKKPIAFLWQGGVNISTQDVSTDRWETYNGEIEEASAVDVSYTNITAPVPPYIDVAGLHAQDAPQGGGQQRRNPSARRSRSEPDRQVE